MVLSLVNFVKLHSNLQTQLNFGWLIGVGFDFVFPQEGRRRKKEPPPSFIEPDIEPNIEPDIDPNIDPNIEPKY